MTILRRSMSKIGKGGEAIGGQANTKLILDGGKSNQRAVQFIERRRGNLNERDKVCLRSRRACSTWYGRYKYQS